MTNAAVPQAAYSANGSIAGAGGNSKTFHCCATTQPQPVADHAERGLTEIKNVAELDEMLLEVDVALAISDDAMRAKLNSFKFVLPETATAPTDPFSAEYGDFQMALYELIAGRRYHLQNERSDWIIPEHKVVPFPFYTGSWQTVSDQLLMVGLIVKTLCLPSKASILEFGPGWGNTTMALSQMGYRVTAIDIEERFLAIIPHRCADFPNPPRLIAGDFLEVQRVNERFDAILFYESFHHCSDHRRLVSCLADRLNPGGQVAFASEPITDSFPIPWGLRLDGGSVWSTRRFGWLELGYSEVYFREVMRRASFAVEKHVYPVTAFGTITWHAANLPWSHVDRAESPFARSDPHCTGDRLPPAASPIGVSSIVPHDPTPLMATPIAEVERWQRVAAFRDRSVTNFNCS